MPNSSQSSDAAPKPKHGGKRPGAGRKPAGYTSPTALTPLDRQAILARSPPQRIESAAQQYARTSIASLAKRLEFGSSDAARVAAANSILDRGYGRPAVDVGGDSVVMAEAEDLVVGIGAEIRTEARKFALLAIEVLRRISEFSTSESASVSASNALLARGLGIVAPAKLPDEVTRSLGKREKARVDAREAAIGVFETPPPPIKFKLVQ